MRSISKEQEEFLDECTIGTWKLNTETGLADIDGSFYCTNRELSDFLGIKFGEVRGDFNCSNNRLVSLEGAPVIVKGDFFCHINQLLSIKKAPKRVNGYFNCTENKLVSLEGAPKYIGMGIFCDPLSLRNFPIIPMDKIYFRKDGRTIELIKYIKEIANGLSHKLYFEKML